MPRPIPVLPSSSRFKIASTIDSCSSAESWPDETKLRTSSRITPSLSEASNSDLIALVVTKSANFMKIPLFVLRPKFANLNLPVIRDPSRQSPTGLTLPNTKNSPGLLNRVSSNLVVSTAA